VHPVSSSASGQACFCPVTCNQCQQRRAELGASNR
jgi:hypothetical protein